MDNFCCIKKEQEQPLLSVFENIEKLELIISALEVKCKGLKYKATQHELTAKRFKIERDKVGYESELKIRNDALKYYKKYNALLVNVSKIRNSIEESQTMSSVADSMSIANKILVEALKTVDPEKIEDLMADLEENTNQITDIGMILATPIGETDDEVVDFSPQEEEIIFPEIIKKKRVSVKECQLE